MTRSLCLILLHLTASYNIHFFGGQALKHVHIIQKRQALGTNSGSADFQTFYEIVGPTLEFKVSAAKEAIIGLSSNPPKNPPEYQIIIGANSNTRTILKKNGVEVMNVDSPSILSATEERMFYILMDPDAGTIVLGNPEDILMYKDKTPVAATHCSFRTPPGVKGTWSTEDGQLANPVNVGVKSAVSGTTGTTKASTKAAVTAKTVAATAKGVTAKPAAPTPAAVKTTPKPAPAQVQAQPTAKPVGPQATLTAPPVSGSLPKPVWKPESKGRVPAGALLSDKYYWMSEIQMVYVGRSVVYGNTIPCRLWANETCWTPFPTDPFEYDISTYEGLIGTNDQYKWIPWKASQNVPATAVVGGVMKGADKKNVTLYIGKAEHELFPECGYDYMYSSLGYVRGDTRELYHVMVNELRIKQSYQILVQVK